MSEFLGYCIVFLVLGFVFAFWINLVHYVFIRFFFVDDLKDND